MKQKLSSSDLCVLVTQAGKTLVGMRLANIYDIDPKTYLLKFARGDEPKKFMIVEAGMRLHPTGYERERADMPSAFTMRLRRVLRTKVLNGVTQVGADRVVVLTFGADETRVNLVFEFYAKGNVIMTDHTDEIMAVLRPYTLQDGRRIAVKEKYDFGKARPDEPITREKLRSILFHRPKELSHETEEENDSGKGKGKGKNKGKKVITLKQVLNTSLDLGPDLIDHSILSSDLSLSLSLSLWEKEEDMMRELGWFERLYNNLVGAEELLRVASTEGCKGYILFTPQSGKVTERDISLSVSSFQRERETGQQRDKEGKGDVSLSLSPKELHELAKEGKAAYVDVTPYLLKQHQGLSLCEFSSFPEALDEFFSQSEAQKAEEKRRIAKELALKKVDSVKKGQNERMNELIAEYKDLFDKAIAIEANYPDVDAAILAVLGGLASGIDWDELWNFIKAEKRKGDSVAMIIHSLNLKSNTMNLLLPRIDSSEEKEKILLEQSISENDYDNFGQRDILGQDETEIMLCVPIDLSLSAQANASHLHSLAKRSLLKQQRHIETSELAVEKAVKKAGEQVREITVKGGVERMRKVMWFERYYWCLTADNYLIVSGRDAHQNENLVKRYMSEGDLFSHADIHGGAATVLKVSDPSKEIPPSSLEQACEFAAARSSAWTAKTPVQSYWVKKDQVSKTAPTGEYLVTGSFVIRGKKNYLPSRPLILGCGILFRIDESSLGNHVKRDKEREREIEGERDIDNDAGKEREILKERENKREREKGNRERESEEITVVNGEKEENEPVETPTFRPLRFGAESEDEGKVSMIQGSIPAPKPQKEREREKVREKEERERKEREEMKMKEREQQKKISAKKKKAMLKHADADEEDLKLHKALLNPDGPAKKQKTKQEKKLERKERHRRVMEHKRELKARREHRAENRSLSHSLSHSHSLSSYSEEYSYTYYSTDDEKKERDSKKEREDKKEREEKKEREGETEREREKVVEKRGVVRDKDAENLRRKERERKERMEIDMINEEENFADIGDKEKASLTDLDYLISNPVPGDMLLYAIPVVAPYAALANYAYKVKMIPGTTKRGKAVEGIMHEFEKISKTRSSARERDLLKAMGINDLVNSIPNGVKIVISASNQKK